MQTGSLRVYLLLFFLLLSAFWLRFCTRTNTAPLHLSLSTLSHIITTIQVFRHPYFTVCPMTDAAERIIALRSIGWKCRTAAEIAEIALVLGPAELIVLYHRLWKGTDAEFCLHAGIQLVSMLRACYLLISTLCVSLVRCVLTHSSSTL
jgi:hypothetical protein